jgi:hypothetical protein
MVDLFDVRFEHITSLLQVIMFSFG